MNKKIVGILIVIIIICTVGIVFLLNGNSKNNQEKNSNNVAETTDNSINDNKTENKVLVVYFSAQNHTREVSNKIASNLNADTFEIVPKQIYTSDDLDWTNSSSRVSREHNDESLRNIELVSTDVNNWHDYDTVLIGYPIWWGIAAWPVDTFVRNNVFNGKTVIPFCTSMSSDLGESGELLKEISNGGNWLEGHRFNSNATDADIKTFTDNINYGTVNMNIK